jgi:ribose/xylose/arabinose/galactoside ABC-type transport system permease subunit
MRMSRNKLMEFFLNNLIWFVLLLVIVVFSLTTKNFFTTQNLVSILLETTILGILTIGQTVVLISGNFDLSAEGTVSLVTVLAAWLMLPYRSMAVAQRGGIGWEVSPLIVIPTILAIGTLAGFINGIFVARLRMNNFIVTLSMQLILRGIAFVVSMGAVMSGTPSLFNWLGSGLIGPIPASVILTLILFFVFAAILHYTRFGRELYAVGANKYAALASGFKPHVSITWAYTISGFLAGLAGWILLGRVQASNPSLGLGMTLQTVAAAVIGGVALTGGSGTMLGALAGVLLVSVIADGMNLINMNPYWIDGVRGLIIFFALLLEAQKVRVKVRSVKTASSASSSLPRPKAK